VVGVVGVHSGVVQDVLEVLLDEPVVQRRVDPPACIDP
jgi:hypothetical protein